MLRRPVARLSSFVGLLAVLVVGPSLPALAHDELRSSTPADGTTVTAVPTALELTFSAEILDVNPQVVAVDADGTEVTSGDVELDGTVVRRALSPEAAGDISVAWSVASSDGHRIEGEFTFTISVPAPSPSESVEPTLAVEPSESVGPTLAVEPSESVEPAATPEPSASVDVAADPGAGADTDSSAQDPMPLGMRLALAAGATAVVLTLGVLAIRKARGLDGRDRSTGPAADEDDGPEA